MELPSLSKKVKDVSSILVSLGGISKSEADTLTELKFSDGEKILSLEEVWFIYEMVWVLKQVGYEKTLNFLSVNWEKVLGKMNIRKKMLFENPLMEKTKEKFALDMEIYRNKVDVEKGEPCKRCRSENTIAVSVQNRSSDEAETIKIRCLSCNFRWTAQ